MDCSRTRGSTRRIRIENRTPQAGKTRLRLIVGGTRRAATGTLGAPPLAPQRAQTARWGPRRLRPARPVAGLRRLFRAITTAWSDGFRRERAESLKKFVNNPGLTTDDWD